MKKRSPKCEPSALVCGSLSSVYRPPRSAAVMGARSSETASASAAPQHHVSTDEVNTNRAENGRKNSTYPQCFHIFVFTTIMDWISLGFGHVSVSISVVAIVRAGCIAHGRSRRGAVLAFVRRNLSTALIARCAEPTPNPTAGYGQKMILWTDDDDDWLCFFNRLCGERSLPRGIRALSSLTLPFWY